MCSMNAEQLNGLLSALAKAHKSQGTVEKMAAVRSALESIAGDPANPAHQTQFREQLNILTTALRVDGLNEFSVREEAIIDDLGLRNLVGAVIEQKTVGSIAGQELTPRVAADAFIKIHDDVQNKLNKIREIAAGLTELGIDKGEPERGTVELGMFVPRPESDLTLAQILEEGSELNRLVSAAYEVVEGKPESPPVRYLTSSDYGFLLEVAPQVVAFVVLAVERSLALYKGWLEVQALHKQLKDKGTPDTLIDPLREESKKKLDLDIHAAIKAAVEERSPSTDTARKNELTNQVVAEVKIFLNKAERGNYLDIRVGMEKAPAEQDGEAPEAAKARERVAVLKEVKSLAQRLHALEKRGEAVKLIATDGETTDEVRPES